MFNSKQTKKLKTAICWIYDQQTQEKNYNKKVNYEIGITQTRYNHLWKYAHYIWPIKNNKYSHMKKSKRRNGWSFKYAFLIIIQQIKPQKFHQSQTLYRKYNILKALKIFEAFDKFDFKSKRNRPMIFFVVKYWNF